MTTTQSHLSLEYLRYPVAARVAGAPHDPTTDVVQFAFPLAGINPVTWVSGVWETVGSIAYAIVLVGTGGTFVPSAGTYDVWVKITDNPEIPIKKIDSLVVT